MRNVEFLVLNVVIGCAACYSKNCRLCRCGVISLERNIPSKSKDYGRNTCRCRGKDVNLRLKMNISSKYSVKAVL